MKTYNVKLLEDVKQLIVETNLSDSVKYNDMPLLYPKHITTFNHFIVSDDRINDKLYQILEPHLYKGLLLYKCHTAPYEPFKITIDDEVFE